MHMYMYMYICVYVYEDVYVYLSIRELSHSKARSTAGKLSSKSELAPSFKRRWGGGVRVQGSGFRV